MANEPVPTAQGEETIWMAGGTGTVAQGTS